MEASAPGMKYVVAHRQTTISLPRFKWNPAMEYGTVNDTVPEVSFHVAERHLRGTAIRFPA